MSLKPTNFPKLHGRWLAWALLLGLPMLFWPDTADAYSTIRWGVMSALGMGLWLTSWQQRGEIWAAVAPPIRWAVLAFTLVGIVGCPLALHPDEALWQVARWVMALGLLLQLVYAIGVHPGLWRDLFRAGAIAGIALGSLRLLQFAGIVGGIPADTDAHSAMQGNPNFFAGAMVMLAALSCGAALREKGLWRWLGLVSGLLCCLHIAIGRSEGAMLALATGAVVMVEGAWVMLRPDSAYAKRPTVRGAIVGAVALAGLLGFAWILARPLPDLAVQPDSTQERILLWQQSFKMVQGSPLLGIGAGHWQYHILKWGAVSNYQGFATRYFMEAHNDFVQQFAERGILGGLAFLGVFVLAWLRGFRSLRRGGRDLGRVAALGGLTGGMVFACTSLPAEQPYLLVLLLILLAMLSGIEAAAPSEASTDNPQPGLSLQTGSPVLATGIWLLFLLGAAASLGLHGLWLGAERDNFEMMLAKGKQDWPRTNHLAHKAAAWYNPHDRVSCTPIAWYEGVSLLSQGNAALALPKLQAAKAQHPWHPQVCSNLGAAYFMLGNFEAATLEFEALVERFPDFGEARMNLSECYMTTGKLKEAAATIDYWRTRTGNPQFNDYYDKISGILKANGVGQ